MRADLMQDGISVAWGPTVRVGLSSFKWYVRELGAQCPEIVHLHTPNTELMHFLSTSWPASLIFPKFEGRMIRTLHSAARPTALGVRLVYRCNRAAATIACGESVRRVYSPMIKGSISTVANGAEFPDGFPSAQSRADARRRLGIALDGFHAICVARMSGASTHTAPKAHDVLIKGWKESAVGKNGGVLHLIGDGELRGTFEALSGNDPSIEFHGVKTNVSEWHRAADVFVLASRWEGLPVAAIEAVGAGLPCILSDIGPFRELRPPSARWFRVEDHADLGRQLKMTLDGAYAPPRQEIVRFRRRFSIEATAQGYLEIYRRHGA